jgi:hypothetical protein
VTADPALSRRARGQHCFSTGLGQAGFDPFAVIVLGQQQWPLPTRSTAAPNKNRPASGGLKPARCFKTGFHTFTRTMWGGQSCLQPPFLAASSANEGGPNIMKYGCGRVSTDDQSPALQLAALKKAGCKTIFKDDGLSGATTKRPAV